MAVNKRIAAAFAANILFATSSAHAVDGEITFKFHFNQGGVELARESKIKFERECRLIAHGIFTSGMLLNAKTQIQAFIDVVETSSREFSLSLAAERSNFIAGELEKCGAPHQLILEVSYGVETTLNLKDKDLDPDKLEEQRVVKIVLPPPTLEQNSGFAKKIARMNYSSAFNKEKYAKETYEKARDRISKNGPLGGSANSLFIPDGEVGGYGQKVFKEGSVFIGYMKSDREAGYGMMRNARGDVYYGGFSDNLPDGSGVLYGVDGSVFAGDFKNGEKSGYGGIKYANGDIFEGQWMAGAKHGYGVSVIGKEERYENWSAGVRK